MLELAVLGLLKERPMHGYQLSRELSETLGGLWRVSYGSLYPSLRRLERDGAIESEAGDQRGARRKKVYRITETGESMFLDLLQEAPQEGQAEDARFRMRLAFFRYLSPETRIRLLERRRQALQRRLSAITESLRGPRTTDDYGTALIEHSRETIGSDISWLDGLIAAERRKSVSTGGLNRRRAALRGGRGSSGEAVAPRKERVS
jgi:DNA-binding PadR family transcriptional regulator